MFLQKLKGYIANIFPLSSQTMLLSPPNSQTTQLTSPTSQTTHLPPPTLKKHGLWGNLGGSTPFLFERTALDGCVSIDIAEKYKTTALGGHRQENNKKRKQQTRPIRLGRQHGLPLNYTHWPVGLGHQHGQTLNTTTTEEKRHNRSFHLPSHSYGYRNN